MEEGWVKLYRKFLNWEWHTSPETVSLLFHLLLMANHEEKKWNGMTIKRGQLVTSRNELCKETGLSERKLRTCINRLKSTSELTIKSTNKFSIITICNYDRYQAEKEQSVQQNVQQTDQQPSSNRPTNKNERNNNIYTTPTAPAHTRESWTFISSVRRSVLGNDPERIAEFKKELFLSEAQQMAPVMMMTDKQLDGFVRYWTEHTKGSEKIRAEYEMVFDMKSRIQNWIDRDIPKPGHSAQQKNRSEGFEDNMNFVTDFFNGDKQRNTSPDEQ